MQNQTPHKSLLFQPNKNVNTNICILCSTTWRFHLPRFKFKPCCWGILPLSKAEFVQMSWKVPRHSQVLLSSSLRQAGSKGLMCCSFCARMTWILGTREAGGLCTLCSSRVSMHSMGSRLELSLQRGHSTAGLTNIPGNCCPSEPQQLEAGQEQRNKQHPSQLLLTPATLKPPSSGSL